MSFFDKLKNSMGVENSEEEIEEEEKREREEDEKAEKGGKKEKNGKKESEEKEEKEKPSAVRKIQIKGDTGKENSPNEKPKQKKSEEQEWFQPEGELAVDVFQTDDAIIIQSTIAGVKPEELDLSIENDVVTITGERKNPNGEAERSYYYQECYWGPFSRQIILPEEIDFNQAEASMKDGIFTLRLPKLLRQKVRKIKVRG